jgi:tyrosyl-tRNA synthetase
MTDTNARAVAELIERGVENIYPSRDFLKSKLESGESLTVYLGIDPTAPTLHVGNMIPMKKLAAFQALGHKVILLIGDFTATIGDPDKMSLRRPLTHEQVLENAKKYKEQASRLLRFDGENAAEIKYNSAWLAKLSFADVINLASHMTHSQLVKRDMFQKRIASGGDLYLHEFLYPLMQGYDSVAMDVDGEVGGNDQTFNMLAGRDLLKKMKGKEKFVITTKLLADSEGVKMGKTTGNMVSLSDTPENMFGKVMSWTDSMIVPGFELCTNVSSEEISQVQKEMLDGANPRDAKIRLAFEITKLFLGDDAAEKGRDHFEKAIQKKEIPDDVPTVKSKQGLLVDILLMAQIVKSKTEFRRLVEENAVSVYRDGDSLKLSDAAFVVDVSCVVKIGKHRFLKVEIE